MTDARRKPAKQPARRTVTVTLAGEFEEWAFTARADFRAKVIADLQSGDMDRIIRALDSVLVDYNFPDADTGELADGMGNVDTEGLGAVLDGLFDAIGKLPNR